MRVDKMVSDITSTRSRLGLPTPCPQCSQPDIPVYCAQCVNTLADFLGVSREYARDNYGRKRVRPSD